LPVPLTSRRFILAALVALGLMPTAAEAHAILLASSPAVGGSVPAGQVAMEFRFNSRIDRLRSRLTLTRPDRSQTVLPIRDEGPEELLYTTVALTPGAYTVRWQVLAVDGHITRGDVAFTVTGP
jgi:methionine-rich copper-binding protein CopC